MAKNFGDDLLVSTSVHVRVGTLKQLRELFPKSGSSRFIREAVEEKLQREGGVRSTISRLRSERNALSMKVKSMDSTIAHLEQEAERLDAMNLENQRRSMIGDALANVQYASVEDVFKDLEPVLKIQDKKDETFVRALIDEEWRKRNASVQERLADGTS